MLLAHPKSQTMDQSMNKNSNDINGRVVVVVEEEEEEEGNDDKKSNGHNNFIHKTTITIPSTTPSSIPSSLIPSSTNYGENNLIVSQNICESFTSPSFHIGNGNTQQLYIAEDKLTSRRGRKRKTPDSRAEDASGEPPIKKQAVAVVGSNGTTKRTTKKKLIHDYLVENGQNNHSKLNMNQEEKKENAIQPNGEKEEMIKIHTENIHENNNNNNNNLSNNNNAEQLLMTELLNDMFQMDCVNQYFYELSTYEKYSQLIKKPMSLNLMREKLSNGKYSNIKTQFNSDVMLLCRNTFTIYPKNSNQYKLAAQIKRHVNSKIMKLGKKKNARSKKEGTEVFEDNDRLHGENGKDKSLSKRGRSTEQNGHDNNVAALTGLKVIKKEDYETIDDYVFVCDEEILRQKLTTSKVSGCDGEHCHDLNKLGPFNTMQETWESECNDRKRRIECGDACKCDPDKCKNRGVTKKQEMKLLTDVREQFVYGIDKYTHNNIESILPDAIVELTGDENAKHTFIEEQLLPAMNEYEFFVGHVLPQYASKRPLDTTEELGRAPFYMTDVLRMLLYKAEQQGDVILQQVISYAIRIILSMGLQFINQNEDYSIPRAKHITTMSDFWTADQHLAVYEKDNVLATGEGSICDEEFPIYSKGTGVVCIRSQGIQQNQFIVPFFGEVYPAWYWYEKSDRIRWLEKSHQAEKQPDFFNIMLERHTDDPDGFDVLFIDPSKKGNYASRLSHSCRPNCIAVSMAVHGKFQIAVYALRDIKCGEELCFDYNSVTEDEQEWKQAVCLCGMKNCRNYYLSYAGTGSYTDVLHHKHNFLHRTAALYQACDNTPIQEEDKELFVKYSIGNSVLNGVPDWMKKYCIQILRYVESEDTLLPSELMKLGFPDYTIKDAEEEAFGVKRTRIQNLVLTLNKMKFFFSNSGNARRVHIPPLQLLNDQTVANKIWIENDGLISNLRSALELHLGADHPLTIRVHEMDPCSAQDIVTESRKCLQEIRDELRKLKPTRYAYHHAAADCIDFYLHTKYWFTAYNYDSFKSKVFSLRELGYMKDGNAPPKKYNPQYVWGQLNFWERQTIEQPDASLSQSRRGTIALPNIECCYSKSIKSDLRRAYDRETRQDLLELLQNKAGNPWTTRWHWNFRNGKIYGAPWLDAHIDGNEQKKLDQFLQELREIPVNYLEEDNSQNWESSVDPIESTEQQISIKEKSTTLVEN